MKIIKENAVYVQKSDLVEAFRIGVRMPFFLAQQACHYAKFSTAVDTRFDFIKYTEEEDMNFLKNFNYILDYEELSVMTRDELYEKAKRILIEKRNLVANYEYWNEDVLKRYQLLNLELECIRNFVWNERKDKNFSFDIPSEFKEQPFFQKLVSKIRNK